MFWKDRTGENAHGGLTARKWRIEKNKQEQTKEPEKLVAWADRVIINRSGDGISGRKKKSPFIFITVLTLTVLILCIALISIYK